MPAPKTTTKAKLPVQVTMAPSSPQPRDSNERLHDRSTVPQSDNESANGKNMGENNAMSSNYGNGPITLKPNHPRTCTANIHQHPGDHHNTYNGKRHTKDEMVKARHLAAINKAAKAEEAKRQAMEYEDSM